MGAIPLRHSGYINTVKYFNNNEFLEKGLRNISCVPGTALKNKMSPIVLWTKSKWILLSLGNVYACYDDDAVLCY